MWSNPLCGRFLGYRPAVAGRTFLDVTDGNGSRGGWTKFAGELFSEPWLPHDSCCLLFGCYQWGVVPDVVGVAVLVVVVVVVMLWLLLSLAAVAGHGACKRAGGLELMLEL